MASWASVYKSMQNVGTFAGTFFEQGEVSPLWNYLYNELSGIRRTLTLDASYQGGTYKGGVPASGIELDWSDIESISTDENNPTTLYGVLFTKQKTFPKNAFVLKAWRSTLSDWKNGWKNISIRCKTYQRVYTDETTFTDTHLSTQTTRAVQASTGGVSGSHTWLEFFNNNGVWCAGISNYFIVGNDVLSSWSLWYPEQSAFEQYFGTDAPEPTGTTSPEFGPASTPAGGYNPDGGHGTFDNSSDIVPVPNLPTKGVTSAGFINVYVIDDNDLATLGEKLFPHFLPAELLADPSQMNVSEMLAVILKSFFGTLISPVGSTVELADNLGIIDILMNGKLIDYVLDCHIIPTAISGATVEGLKVGYRQFNDLQLAKATTDYVEIDCGSLSIGEYWANFLDYSCTVKLFLPFVGFVPIENEYWNGGTIKVIYHFNIIDGSFQAYVIATSSKSELQDTVIGQYGGVCCVHMPITGLQYSNVVAGLVNGTTGAVASGYGGDVAGAVTNALNMAMLRPDAPSSNGYNASSSFLSERIPYLLIERPASQFSEMYDKEIGLPLNVKCTLSTVHGFTVIDNPVLHIACSDSEYQEIVSLLKNGVILP